MNSTLALRINVTQTNYLRVCGSNMKDSMNHVKFFLDFNVTTDSATYVPTSRIIPWHTRKYAGDECTLLTGVPPGQHVLSLVCMAKCYFTHLISYEWVISTQSIPSFSLFYYVSFHHFLLLLFHVITTHSTVWFFLISSTINMSAVHQSVILIFDDMLYSVTEYINPVESVTLTQ